MVCFGFKIVLLLLFSSLLSSVQTKENVKIIDFTGAQDGENISYLTLANQVADPLPDTFILCASHYLEKISNFGIFELYDEAGQPWVTFFFAFYPGSNSTLLAWLFVEGMTNRNRNDLRLLNLQYSLDTHYEKMDLNISPILLQWYHFCLKINTKTGKISFAVNGRFVYENTLSLLKDSLSNKKPTFLRNKLEIGRYVDFQKSKQYSWKVSNLHVFYGNKSNADIAKMTKNLCNASGDYLAWNDMAWNEAGEEAKTVQLPKEEVCTMSCNKQVALPVNLNFKRANWACRNIGRKGMVSIRNRKEMENLLGFMEKYLLGPLQIWTPYNDQDIEGTFIDVSSGENCSYFAWGNNQPNGGVQQNCISLVPAWVPNIYDDESCDKRAAVGCQVECQSSLRLRGLCSESDIGMRQRWQRYFFAHNIIYNKCHIEFDMIKYDKQ